MGKNEIPESWLPPIAVDPVVEAFDQYWTFKNCPL